MKYQHRVLGMLSLLAVITYLDRVCISVAGPRMQDALHIGPVLSTRLSPDRARQPLLIEVAPDTQPTEKQVQSSEHVGAQAMTLGTLIFLAMLGMASQQSPASAAERPCLREQDSALQQICLGDDAAARADKLPGESREGTNELNAAAERYKSAVRLATQSATKIDALKRLATCYDTRHLHEFAQLESALQEWIRIAPTDLSPVYRLAEAQEDDGLIEVAEQTLLNVRHQHPESVEPNTMLMQFYARRVAAVRREKVQSDRQDNAAANERDTDGVYRVGGSIAKPQQRNLGLYEPELISEIPGQVVADITIDESGTVISGSVVRSDSALLDEAALQAVRNWRFQPTAVNGQTVPVKMNVTVTFVPPQSQQQR